jgi:hypothetical protein
LAGKCIGNSSWKNDNTINLKEMDYENKMRCNWLRILYSWEGGVDITGVETLCCVR